MYHNPVMLQPCLDGLNIKPDGVYVDATFGGGGHSRAILQQLGPEGKLYAFDQDDDALANAIDDERFTLIHENFRHLKAHLRLHGVRAIDGLLADLGISSHQIDDASRGFSTRFDAPLDLRMDRRQGFSAQQLVNEYEEEDLARVLGLYGELPCAKRMAKAICSARTAAPIVTTQDLKNAVAHLLPRGAENKFLAMLFQALRIEVNGELDALRDLLAQSTEMLQPEGRMVVMSYHSLEDRLVKNYMRSGRFDGEIQKDFYGNPLTPLQPVTRKAIVADEAEQNTNPRSRSARLRIAKKLLPTEPRSL